MTDTTASTPSAPAATEAPAQATTGEQTAQTTQESPQSEAVKADNKPPVDKVSTKLAKIREREAAIEAKMRELSQKEAQFTEWEGKKKTFKEKPTELLKEFGLSFEDLARGVLEGDVEETPDKKALKVAEEVRAEVAELKRLKQEQEEQLQQASLNKALTDFKTKIKQEIAANAEKFELVASYEADDLVYDIAREYFNRHGEILDISIAAEHAEKFLESRIEKVINTKKLRSRFLPQEKPAQNATLTNKLQSHSAPVQGKPALLSREERLKAALSKLKYD